MLILSTSCNKYLDLQPQDGITKAKFWKTKEDVKAAVFGAYSSLLGSPPGVNDRAIPEYIFIWGELRADMIAPTTYASVDESDIVNMNIQSINTWAKWSAFYRTINYCNTILDFAPQAKTSDATFTDKDYKAYTGEALALRSMMYFYLVRTFQELPLKLTSTSKDTDIKEIGGTPSKDVLTQIIKDLITAEASVPDTYGSVTSDKGRFTKAGVQALLADVYLWNEEYQKSVDECEKIFGTGKFDYVNMSSSWYNTVFFEGSSKETIFEISNKSTPSTVFYNMLVTSRKRYTASEFVGTEIFIPNGTVDADLTDNRGEGTSYTSDLTIVKQGIGNPSYTNFQVYRYSDVKMIAAEANARLNKGVEALKIINDLRVARKALKATEQVIDPSNADEICRYIIEERAREFPFEGKRWFDLLRNAKRDNYSTGLSDLLISSVSKTVDVSVQQSAINKIRDINSHYMPIFENELFTDTKLTQNPFYIK